MPNTFLLRFQRLIEEQGFEPSITKFINSWISGGETFKSLYEWIILRGIDVAYATVYTNLRKFLTIPYDYKDQYWYKWNEIAKARGWESSQQMLESLLRKHTIIEISKILEVEKHTILELKNRLEGTWENPKKSSRPHKTVDGLIQIKANERWKQKWEEKGHRSLKEAIYKMRLKGMTIKEISEEFGISVRGMKYRLKAARLKFSMFPKGRKPFSKILKIGDQNERGMV